MFWVLKRTILMRRILSYHKLHNICFGWEIRKLVFCYTLLTKGLHGGIFSLIPFDLCIFFLNWAPSGSRMIWDQQLHVDIILHWHCNGDTKGPYVWLSVKQVCIPPVAFWVWQYGYIFLLKIFDLTGYTVLCPWARHFILCLVLVQSRKWPNMTENCWLGCKASSQTRPTLRGDWWLYILELQWCL